MLLNALRAAQIEPTALGLLVQPLDADSPSWAWQADKPLNPASLVKLITSAAALDTLGPAWRWQTPVWLQGTLDEQGRLDGTLTIQGSGRPAPRDRAAEHRIAPPADPARPARGARPAGAGPQRLCPRQAGPGRL